MIRRITLFLLSSAILLGAGELRAGQQIWQDISSLLHAVDRKISRFQVDDGALRLQLMRAPLESTGDWSHQIRLPMPDGKIAAFRVVESPVMAAGLAAKYPGIKTFKVRGIDDSLASGRVGITPLGLHAMIHTSAGAIYLDPEEPSSQTHVYRSRFKADVAPQQFSCGIHDTQHPLGEPVNSSARVASRTEGELLEYRIAVAATIEYHQSFGASLANTMTEIILTIMRVNTIYERDLGITLNLIGQNNKIIETVDNGLLNNENSLVLLGQVENWIDTRLTNGDADYDIGHMFSAPKFVGGGVAFLGVVCNDDFKANGVTGLPNPDGVRLGDPFDIDFVAHEIGHQFNADHSFNGTTNSCAGGRNQATAFEPGSGSTIMAYAGICGGENLQLNSDATFHPGSITQIDSYTKGAGSCAVPVATIPADNIDPTITAIANRTIPANTPFILDGTASDLDTLSYQWDQMDAGCPTDSASFGTDNGSNALFRSFLPRDESARNFPAMGTQFLGQYDDAEVLPCTDRDLDFRLTVRDGRSGQDVEDVTVSVRKTGAAFEITNLDSEQTITNPNAFDVTWNVANTDQAPVNCPNVDIDLLTFSDTAPTDPATYSIHPLVANLPNIGIASVSIIPVERSHPRARIRVKCSNNIFYDISDADLIIAGTGPNFTDTDFSTFINNNVGTIGAVAPACGAVVECTAPPPEEESGSKGGGGGTFDYLWLLLMTGLIALINLYRRYGMQ